MKSSYFLPGIALLAFSTVCVNAATYTFTGTAPSSAWTGTNFTPNGVPGPGDTIIYTNATGGLNMGTGREVANIDASTVTGAQSILGASGSATTLTVSGTLSKGGAGSFTVRTLSSGTTLSFNVNHVEVAAGGNLNFGSSSGFLAGFSATTMNVSGGSTFFGMNDGVTMSIQSLTLNGGPMVLRNFASGSNTLVVNSLSGTSASAEIRTVNGTAGSARATLVVDSTGTSSYAGTLANESTAGTGAQLSFVKSGVGTQNLLSTGNTYTGATTINGGVLGALRLAVGGSNSSIGASSSDAANLVLNGGVLRYLGGGASTDRNFTLGTNGGGLDSAGSGSLNFTSTSAIVLAGTNTARTLALSGSSNGTLAGILGDNGTGATSLVKTGTGRWTLSGQNTYTGSTTISEGTLLLSGAANNIAGSAVVTVATGATLNVASVSGGFTLASGQTLAGGGTVVGAFTLGSGAVLAPGNSPGTLTFDNDLTLLAGSTSNFEINGLTSGLYDLVQELGAQTADFGGTLNLLFQAGFNTVGTVKIFDFSNYDGAFSVVNTSGLASGYTASFNALTGEISVVPEPSTMLLLGMGSAFCLWRLRRRVRS